MQKKLLKQKSTNEFYILMHPLQHQEVDLGCFFKVDTY